MTDELLVVVATPTTAASHCPICGNASDRVHSRYRRTVADLPFGGRQLALRLTVRKFFCSNAGCSRQVFCERLANFVAAYAPSTKRLQSLQRALGVAAGGAAGARLAKEMATPVGGDTPIRRVKAMPREPETPVRCLGIDDFAFRKGQHYGTIPIDLERGRVVDLLKSRDAADVEAWLVAHPGVEIITRDRSSEYAIAATNGAPEAMQVADRWHLLKNIREAIERLLNRRHKAVKACLKERLPSKPERISLHFKAISNFPGRSRFRRPHVKNPAKASGNNGSMSTPERGAPHKKGQENPVVLWPVRVAPPRSGCRGGESKTFSLGETMADPRFILRDGERFRPLNPAQLRQMTTTGELLPVFRHRFAILSKPLGVSRGMLRPRHWQI